MHTVCCVAKVKACSNCASIKAHNHCAAHVVSPMRNAMAADFSWEHSALEYDALYRRLQD